MEKSSFRLWAFFAIGFAAVIGVGVLLVFLNREPQTMPNPTTPPTIPDPITSPIIPAADENPIVASVNDQTIRYSLWLKAVRLDQVLSDLAGQPLPEPGETLQRLINEELVLQTPPQEQAQEPNQVEEYIAGLQNAWGVDDATLVTALGNVGLIRADFERAVARLLTVQASMEALESQGNDTTTWLEEQRASAEIEIDPTMENATVPYTPIAQAQAQTQPQSPLAAPEAAHEAAHEATPIPTDTPVPATASPDEPPSTTATDLALPEIAPDFTLDRAGGGKFTLSEQLAQGPVVLVFFQKCG